MANYPSDMYYSYPSYSMPSQQNYQQSNQTFSRIPMFSRNDQNNQSFYQTTYKKNFINKLTPRDPVLDEKIDMDKVFHRKKNNITNMAKFDYEENLRNHLDAQATKGFKRKKMSYYEDLAYANRPLQPLVLPTTETRAAYGRKILYNDRRPNEVRYEPNYSTSHRSINTDLGLQSIKDLLDRNRQAISSSSMQQQNDDDYYYVPSQFQLQQNPMQSFSNSEYGNVQTNVSNPPVENFKAILDNFYNQVSMDNRVTGKKDPISPRFSVLNQPKVSINNNIIATKNSEANDWQSMQSEQHEIPARSSLVFVRGANGQMMPYATERNNYQDQSSPRSKNTPATTYQASNSFSGDSNIYRANYMKSKLFNPVNMAKRNSSNQIKFNFIDE